MKQNPPVAKAQAPRIPLVILALVLLASACVTQTRQARFVSSEIQTNLAASKAKRGRLVSINTASSQELEKLPGIGKVTAERIVSHREQYGPFRRPEHLMMVRGISDRKFRALRDMIVVD